MPELPEAETLVRAIRPALEGRRIERVVVFDARVLAQSKAAFRRKLTGRRIERAWRRGKWIVISLDSGDSLLVQLRMTGQVRLVPARPPDHRRVQLRLDDGTRVWYCDTRCLGRLTVLNPDELSSALSEVHQGPEAPEIGLAELKRRLRQTRRNVKPFLLDQRAISGIGNLYADEILHAAGLHPERRACELTDAECRRLHTAIRRVLRWAIEHGGSTLGDGRYQTAYGEQGGYQQRHRVYAREGKPCSACGTPVVRKRIAGLIGRSSYFCPVCQPSNGRLSTASSGRRQRRSNRAS
jgi:formamidopyrimidine-DNA glycosylase